MKNIGLALALLLTGIQGYLVGRIVTVRWSIPETSIILQEDTRPLIPVVQIEGIRDGEVVGTVKGEARVFLGEDLVIPDGSGSFAVAAGPLLMNEIAVPVPEWAAYVASKRGKKYYPVDSSDGEGIVPENRVYFRTEGEARAAGYGR